MKTATSIGILIIFYLVGLVGMFTPYRSFFLSLTPYHLLLTFVVMLFAVSKWSGKLIVDMVVIGIVAFVIEWIGVHKGWLFGEYRYGNNLGVKLDGIPVMIAVNWLLVTFSANALAAKVPAKPFIQLVIAAGLMTGLDFLIEPVAIKSDFWYWTKGTIPMYNYVCWFVFSLLFSFWLHRRKSVQKNQVNVVIYVLMLLFFAILN